MEACNSYYYTTRDPFGVAGDFTTAPEISQLFGEMVGAALADCWLRAGSPADAVYAELGPGRGTLAADALRVLRHAGFQGAVHFVETSPVLRSAQKQRLPAAAWHDRIEDLPGAPLLLAANEFLDALPIRQWIGETERCVDVADDRLAFTLDGVIREDSPARSAAVENIARHLADHGGVALIVDYGHSRSGCGDTLQAVRDHRYVDPLAAPGDVDLTAHVDFEAVARAARRSGVLVSRAAPQGRWLETLGIRERASALAEANPQRAREIEAGRRRLCDPDAMGELFKVLALGGRGWPLPAGVDL